MVIPLQSRSGWLESASLPLSGSWCAKCFHCRRTGEGIAISTRGKVIRRGWDWLGVTPTAPERIGGLIEAPELAACLTLNKADFIRSGGRGATYLSYRKALQEVVARQLAAWGDARDSGEEARRRAARPVERDLERVLIDLADDFPLLAALVERREGGQRRLPIGREKDASRVLVAATLAGAAESNGIESEEPLPPEESGAQVSVETAETSEDPLGSESRLLTPGERGPRRPTRYGLSIQFEARPGDPELGRLVESTVWVNEAHPAHARAVASRSEGYHVALAVAMALAPLAVEPSDERRFVNAFLGQWGQALDGRERQRRGARGSLHRR